MARLKLDQQTLQLGTIVEAATGARVKDCFQDEAQVYVVVEPEDVGRAIGKAAKHIKRLERDFSKKVRVIGYDQDVATFIRALIAPIKVESIGEKDGKIVLQDSKRKTKSLLIGRQGKHLALINRAVQRFFNKEVIVE